MAFDIKITSGTQHGENGFPHGVLLHPLATQRDERGTLTEIFRSSWATDVSPVQWNVVTTAAGVLRGVHVHARHVDYAIVVSGRVSLGLRDLRPGSPTCHAAGAVELRGDRLVALTIPPGVAHGFYCHESALLIQAVSEYWDPADELGCVWTDPALGIPWPVRSAVVSQRDAALPALGELVRQLEHHPTFK